jgi:hypothetical protein
MERAERHHGNALRWLLSAISFWLLITVCHGQARYAATGPGSLVTLGATASDFQIDYGKRYLGGVGVYADFNPTWRVGIEGEARFLRYNQFADTHLSTYLVGPRISFGKHRLNPYVKVLAGLGRFNFPYDDATGSYFVIAPGAGLDYRINQRVKLRLIDFEYQEWPQFSFGPIHPYGISAGISFSILRSGTKRGY